MVSVFTLRHGLYPSTKLRLKHHTHDNIDLLHFNEELALSWWMDPFPALLNVNNVKN